MRTRELKKQSLTEFAPLDLARAEELRRLINLAAFQRQAVTIDPGAGVRDTAEVALISPNERTNALVRFQRHY
jgi:hypothetical protein